MRLLLFTISGNSPTLEIHPHGGELFGENSVATSEIKDSFTGSRLEEVEYWLT